MLSKEASGTIFESLVWLNLILNPGPQSQSINLDTWLFVEIWSEIFFCIMLNLCLIFTSELSALARKMIMLKNEFCFLLWSYRLIDVPISTHINLLIIERERARETERDTHTHIFKHLYKIINLLTAALHVYRHRDFDWKHFYISLIFCFSKQFAKFKLPPNP